MKHIRKTPPEYEKKFANFIQGCQQAKAKNVGNMIIAQPWVIGDTYEEVMESLSRLAEAKLVLHIVDPLDRD